jgi:pyrrolidone-carboxylate peptidase
MPSTDAGGYLCGYMLYRALQAFPDKAVGFLHLPPPDQKAPQAQADSIKEILSLALARSDRAVLSQG